MKPRLHVVAIATAALALGLAAGGQAPTQLAVHTDLRDLSAAADVTDGAWADVLVIAPGVGGSGTTVKLALSGLDAAHAGDRFGAHVHVGPCVAGSPATAGPHYNAGGGISEDTEVWLDFVVGPNGKAVSTTHVGFAIASGAAQSIVIHALPTDPATGTAGPRLACIPVPF
jgi:Cu-Zn family superoxide dismutase